MEAEFEHIDKALSCLPKHPALASLTPLELAGAAALLHSLYGGAENILKAILQAKGLDLPSGPTWHRDLLDLAARHSILPESITRRMSVHLAFRHFFIHAYPVNLRPELYRLFRAHVSTSIPPVAGH
jgi:hypothetical protein